MPATIEDVFRIESRRVLATLIRLLGDFDLAEEALQDAFAAAVERWPVDGIPRNPRVGDGPRSRHAEGRTRLPPQPKPARRQERDPDHVPEDVLVPVLSDSCADIIFRHQRLL